MPNFLNNLVARTLNIAPLVQPRINSRFEPVNPVAATAPDQSVEIEAPPPQPHRPTVRGESRVDEPARVAAVPHVEREQPNIDFQRVINTVRNTYVESHDVVHVPVVEKVSERVFERSETRINTEKTDSRLEIRENRNPEPAPAPKTLKEHPSNPRLNTPEPTPVTREVPVTTPRPIVPRTVTRVEPAPITPAPRFEILPAPQPEPTETINVTIGRVDVRAVFSAQLPKTSVRTSSTNSLDDYLKQRSGGRR